MEYSGKFHKLSLPCPKCGKQARVLIIYVRGDITIHIDGLCDTCGEDLSFEFDLKTMMTACVLADYAEAGGIVKKPKPIVKPDKNDDDFLREMGIDPENGV